MTHSYEADQAMACEFKDMESGRVEQFQLHPDGSKSAGPFDVQDRESSGIEGLKPW